VPHASAHISRKVEGKKVRSAKRSMKPRLSKIDRALVISQLALLLLTNSCGATCGGGGGGGGGADFSSGDGL
jgi:hypothetical protein